MAKGRIAATAAAEPVEGPWALPDGWRWARLSDACRLVERGTPASRFKDTFRYTDVGGVGEGIASKVVEVADAPSRARQFVRPGDTLFSGVRINLRRTIFVKPDMTDVASTAFSVLSPDKGVDPRYLFLWTTCDWFIEALLPLQRGAQPPAVLDDDVRGQPIPFPSLATQHRIASRVDELFTELDDGEAALARAKADLGVWRKALLKAAVTGELTADWRAERAKSGPPAETGTDLLHRILADRRARWTANPKNKGKRYAEPESAKSGLPVLPDRWCWTTAGVAGEVKQGRQRAPTHHDGDNMRPYLRVANVREGWLDLRDVKQMNFNPEEFATYELKSGDILLNEGQSPELLGRPAIYSSEIDNCCFQNTLLRFRPTAVVRSDYALVVFRRLMHSQRFLKESRITTNLAHLTLGRFLTVEFPLPSIDEQVEIARRVKDAEASWDPMVLDPSVGMMLRRSILAAAFRGDLVQ